VSLRVGLLTLITLVAFAANSVLCRMALAAELIDPVAFTALRLASGVFILIPLAALTSEPRPAGRPAGSWGSGLALFIYAMAFSLAYVSLETGTGALILFGSVQVTMIGVGLWQGERPAAREWLGLVVAMVGLVYLVFPGITAPDPVGAVLMTMSGIGWGVYSLRGRGRKAPIVATAGNFARALPLALVGLVIGWGWTHFSPRGAALAVISGGITSGLGYVIWYVTLRDLSATRAAIVQLAVPVLAAAGGIAILSEEPTLRLGVASLMILGGIGMATIAGGRATTNLVRRPENGEHGSRE
jgi:drug/metabolite transporter (DMT)-like permease